MDCGQAGLSAAEEREREQDGNRARTIGSKKGAKLGLNRARDYIHKFIRILTEIGYCLKAGRLERMDVIDCIRLSIYLDGNDRTTDLEPSFLPRTSSFFLIFTIQSTLVRLNWGRSRQLFLFSPVPGKEADNDRPTISLMLFSILYHVRAVGGCHR